VIRTAVITPDGLSYGVGGAIVALSDPAAEYEETAVKAIPLLRALGIAFPGADPGGATRQVPGGPGACVAAGLGTPTGGASREAPPPPRRVAAADGRAEPCRS